MSALVSLMTEYGVAHHFRINNAQGDGGDADPNEGASPQSGE